MITFATLGPIISLNERVEKGGIYVWVCLDIYVYVRKCAEACGLDVCAINLYPDPKNLGEHAKCDRSISLNLTANRKNGRTPIFVFPN